MGCISTSPVITIRPIDSFQKEVKNNLVDKKFNQNYVNIDFTSFSSSSSSEEELGKNNTPHFNF